MRGLSLIRRLLFGLTGILALVVCVGAAFAQTARPDLKTAAVPVMKQLEAFRRGDFDTAYTFASGASRAIRPPDFETMVRRGYPEIARSSFAAVVKTELPSEGDAYVDGEDPRRQRQGYRGIVRAGVGGPVEDQRRGVAAGAGVI